MVTARILSISRSTKVYLVGYFSIPIINSIRTGTQNRHRYNFICTGTYGKYQLSAGFKVCGNRTVAIMQGRGGSRAARILNRYITLDNRPTGKFVPAVRSSRNTDRFFHPVAICTGWRHRTSGSGINSQFAFLFFESTTEGMIFTPQFYIKSRCS